MYKMSIFQLFTRTTNFNAWELQRPSKGYRMTLLRGRISITTPILVFKFVLTINLIVEIS